MNDAVRGLILKSMDFREYDALITVLTKEYGKLTFRAAGVRRMTSKNAGSLLPYTEAEIAFDYHPNKTMFSLKTARTLSLYRHMHEDITASMAASAVAEIADAFSLGGEINSAASLYNLVNTAFRMLDERKNGDLVLSLYIGDIMRLNGIEPNVDACVHDGNHLVAAISAIDGGFLCTECAHKYGERIRSADELHLFRLIVKAGLKHYDVISNMHVSVSWCLRILEEMLERQGNVKIRSFMLYNRITDID